jgi:hypothetical protein
MEFEKGKQDYHECPVWKHRTNRTFIGTSPIDVKFVLDINSDKILSTRVDGFSPLYQQNYDLQSEYAVIQLTFPSYYFWVDDNISNLWFEMLDHPLTSLKNNFIIIGGWWNLAGYPRSISVAIKVVNKNKNVIIKKGDPLYRIRFYPDNLNNGVKLVKSDILPEKIKNQYILNKSGDPKTMNRRLFSKCPFKSLFKND